MRRSQSANKYSQETRTGKNRSKLPERRRNFILENSLSEENSKAAPITVSGSNVNKGISIYKHSTSSSQLSEKKLKPSSVLLHSHKEINIEQNDSQNNDSNWSSNAVNMQQFSDKKLHVTANSVLFSSSSSVKHEVSTPLIPPLDLRNAVALTKQNSDCGRSEKEIWMEIDKEHTPHRDEEEEEQSKLRIQHAATQRTKRTQPTNLFSMEVETSPLPLSQMRTESCSSRTQKLASTRPKKQSASSSFSFAQVTKAKTHITRYANKEHTSEHKPNVGSPSLIFAESAPWSFSAVSLMSSSNSSSLLENANTFTRKAECAREAFQLVHTHNSYLSTADHDHNNTQVETYTHRSSATRTSAQRWSPRSDLVITPRPASALYKMLFAANTSTQQNYYISNVHSSLEAKARANGNYPPHHNDDENDAFSDNFTAECYSQPMIPVAHIRIRPLLPNLHERNDQRKVFLLNHQHLLICSSAPVAHASSYTSNIYANSNKTNNCSPVKCNKQEVRTTSSNKNIKGPENVQQEEHEYHKETRPESDVNKIRYKETNESLYSSVKQKTLASSTPRPVLTARRNVTTQKSNNICRSNKTSDAEASSKKIQQQQQQQRHHFTFEFIHDEDAAQQDVFEESVLPFVDEALMGHNVAICCYGPTGSGKTYSMIGESNEMPWTYRHGRHLNREWKNYVNTNRERVNKAQCKRSASAFVVVSAGHRDKLSKRIASTRSRSSAVHTETNQNITKRKMFNNYKDYNKTEDELEEQESARGENVEMSSNTTAKTEFAYNNAMSESDIGILPRLVLVLLERRNKPQYIIRESHATVQAAPNNNTITTGNGTEKTEMTLKLMLTSITFYGVELYLDDLSNLLDPQKRTLSTNALSDIGGVSTLCTAIDKEWREWCEVDEVNAEHIHTQRQASLEKCNVKEHKVNVNDRKVQRASLPSSFMQNFSAFYSSDMKNTKKIKEKSMHTSRSVCSEDNANVNVIDTTSPSPAWREEIEELKNARESGNTSEESPPAKEPILETQSNYTNDSNIINNNCNYCTPRTRRNRKENRQGGITINSLTDLHLACELARVNRITSRHALNDTSSRSHALYVLRLDFDLSQEYKAQSEKEHTENEIQHHADNNNNTSRENYVVQPEHFSSYVTLVDLAGSERVKDTNVHGKEMKEAQYINKSLSALSNVVLALYQRSAHVPYRDSKLTRLLRPCLSEGRVLVLVHVAPCNAHNESVQTLKFADQIRHAKVQAHKSSSNISNHPVQSNKYSSSSTITTNTRKNQDVCVGNFTRLAGIAVRSKNVKVNAKGNEKNCNEECEEESGAALHEEDINEKQLLETFAELTQHSHFDVEEEMIKHTWERDAICADLRIFTANRSTLSSNRDVNTSSKSESVFNQNNKYNVNKEDEYHDNNKSTDTKECTSNERNNNNYVPHNPQVQELLNRYVEHCLLDPAQDSIEVVESQLEQANAMHIAQCQEKWNNKITGAEEELEECVKVNRTLKSEAMTPLPLDPYVNQLIHETQACDNDLESITAERDQLRGLVALLRQRLSTHDDLLHELEREWNEVQLQKRQQARLVCSATQTTANDMEHVKNSPNASIDEYSREASPLNISFTSSVSSVMTEDSTHETSYSYSHTNSDITKTGVLHLENKTHAVSMPRAKMLSASWRHVLADQLRLAKQMALLRTEVECFHHTDDIYEGLWARLMRMQMLLAVQVQNAALESILREPSLLEFVCHKNKALCAPRHKLFTLIQGNSLTETENEYNIEKVTEENEERQKECEYITTTKTTTTVHKDEEIKQDNVNVKTPRLENARLDYSNDNNSKGENEQMTNPLDVLYSINSREINIAENNKLAEMSGSFRGAMSNTAIDYNNEENMQRLCLLEMMHKGIECEITFQLQERATKRELPCNVMEKESVRDGIVDRRVCTSTGRLRLRKRNKESSNNSHHGYTLEFWCLARNIHNTTSAKINSKENTFDEHVCVEQSSYLSSSSFEGNAHKRSNNNDNKKEQEQHYSRRVKYYLMQNSNTEQGNVNNKETIDKIKSVKTNNNVIKSKENDFLVKSRNVYTQEEQRERQQLHKYNYITLTNVNKANKVNVNKSTNKQNVKTANLTKANVEAKCLKSKLSNKQAINQPNGKEKMSNSQYYDDDNTKKEDVELCVFALPLSDHRMELELHIIESESECSDENTFPELVLIVNYVKCLSKWDRHQTNHFAHHIQLISGNNMILPALLVNEQPNGKDNNGESKHEHDMKVRGNANNDELYECSDLQQVMELVIRFPLYTTSKAKSVFAIEQIVYALSAVCLPRTDTLVSDKKNLECKMINNSNNNNNDDEGESCEDKDAQRVEKNSNKMNSSHVKLPDHIPYVLLCHDRCNLRCSSNHNTTRSTSTLYTVPTESTEHKERSASQRANQPTFTIVTTSSARGRRQRHCLAIVSQPHAADSNNTRTDKSPSPEIDEHVIGANLNTRLGASQPPPPPPPPPLRRPIKSAQLETYLHLLQNRTQNSEVSLSNGMHQVICQLASLMFFLRNYFVTIKQCEGNNAPNESHNLQFYYKSIKCVRERIKATTRQIQRYIKQQIFDAEDIKGEEINNCTCSDEEQRKNMEHHSHIEDVIADARKGIGLIFSTAHDYNSESNDEEYVNSCSSADYDREKEHWKDITTLIKCYLNISELRQYLSLRVHWTIWHWAYQWKYIMHACNEQDKQMQESSNAENLQNNCADVVNVDIESNEANVKENERHKNEVDVNNTMHLASLQALFRQRWEKLVNMYKTNGSSGSNRIDKSCNQDRNSWTSHDSDIDEECDYLVDLGSEQFWHLLVEYIHKTDYDHKIIDEFVQCIILPEVELAALPDYLHISEE